MRSRAVTLQAGELIGLPLTATRPAAIQASASRRDANPARAMTLATRSQRKSGLPDLHILDCPTPGEPEVGCKSGLPDLRILDCPTPGEPEVRCKSGLPDLRILDFPISGEPEIRCTA